MKNLYYKLKISHKLFLICIAFGMPIAMLLYFLVLGYDKDIDFAVNETKGNEILVPLINIVTNIQEYHRCVSVNNFNGGKVDDKISDVENQIDKFFEELIEKYKSNNIDTSKTDFEPIHIQNHWNELKTKIYNVNHTELEEFFSEFLRKCNLLNRHIGDEFNLILDPDLDSYYLMDISLLVLPELSKKLFEAIQLYEEHIFSPNDSLFQSNILLYDINVIEKDYLDRIKRGIQISLKSDKSFYKEDEFLQKRLPEEFKKIEIELVRFLRILREYKSLGKSEDFSLETYNETNKNLFITIRNFWLATNNSLGSLLKTRTEYYRTQKTIALSVSVGVLLLAVLLVVYISRRITRPLRFATLLASDIASGNISQAIENIENSPYYLRNLMVCFNDKHHMLKDEIIKLICSIKSMSINLDSLLKQVNKSGNNVSNAALKISGSTHELEATVAEQAASANEANATVKEISKTAQNLASTMNTIAKMADNTSRVANSVLSSITSIKSTMQNISDASLDINSKLVNINEKTANINQVITTITKVANQTNLLSLNAAIEAEKAGKYGAGFAVVALEIRRLADQTAVATLEIEEMIRDMQTAVNDGVVSVETFAKQTNASSHESVKISDELITLIEQTTELQPKIAVVNTSMQSQSEAAAQIKEAMQQLSSAAAQTRDSLLELNNASDKLSNTVEELNYEFERFKISD